MGLLLGDVYYYLLGDRTFYEPLDRREPKPGDYIEQVQRLLPEGWTGRRHGIWFHCTPPKPVIPSHGWKIHVSSTLDLSPAILATVARLLVVEGVPFKFAADRHTLLALNRKRWPRGGAGKFITIYPTDESHCGRLLEGLHAQLVGYEGPHVLSDRRYRDSRVLHYRYGGIHPTKRLNVEGHQYPVIEMSNGEVVPDERRAYFALPPGVVDPFVDTSKLDNDAPGTLRNGRYEIETAIAFSSAGGVYTARDHVTDRTVLIKEARPQSGENADGRDAVYLLRKEFRLLVLLADTGIAPQPVEFFQDWEHYYLVEEYLDGRNFRSHTTGISLALRTRPDDADRENFYEHFRTLFVLIARAMLQLHDRGIVFTDVSHNNIVVLDEGRDVRFIDFEGAYEVGVDPAPNMFTPGFASRQAAAGGGALPADDRFGLGAVMLAGIFPISDLLTLEPQAYEPFLKSFVRDLGLPAALEQCVRGLLSAEREERPHLTEVIDLAQRESPVQSSIIGSAEVDETDMPALVSGCTSYILQTVSFERDDRLFPGAPALFETNGVNVAYGAAGVAMALNRIDNVVDRNIVDWIVARSTRGSAFTPGLYVGSAGIAWSLLELGERDHAETLLRGIDAHPLRWEAPDLFNGAAGWGLAELKFFLETGDEYYLDRATEAGDFLLRTRTDEDSGCYWLTDGIEYSGLGHGGSGIALYLLYLYLATGNEAYLATGLRGVERVISNSVPNPDGGKTWRVHEGHVTRTPYWRWGSAGVGLTLLRYQHVLGDHRYAAALDDIHLDTDRKYAIFPGHHMGLAGIADFYIDWIRFGGGARALEGARKLLSGVLLFRLERESGIAFPGENRMRISCDLGTGTAGIALTMHRFLTQCDGVYMLDELLEPFDGSAGTRPRTALVVRPERRVALAALT